MNGRFNRLVCALCIMFCGLYSVPVTAATAGTAVFQAVNVTKKSRIGGGIKVDYAVKTQFDHPSIPKNKNVSAGFMAADLAVLFASLKNRNPGAVAVGAAVAGAAAGAGWVIDELTGQITRPVQVEKYPDGIVEGYYWNGYVPGITPEDSCGTRSYGPHCTQSKNVCSNSYDADNQCYKSGIIPDLRQCHSGISVCSDPLPPPTTVTEYEPVPQNELDEKIQDWLKKAPWSILDDLLKHPDGTPVDAEPLRRAIGDWLSDLAGRDPTLRYVPPSSIVVTNPDGSETPIDYEPSPDPDPSTEDKPRPDATDWPVFCEWAPVICDWLEWTKEMPEDMEPDELPVDEVHASQFQKDYSHGLGGGSCPAPVTFQYAGQSMQFKYDDACWAASNVFKPVLLTMAGIMAAFIIVGASRRAV